MPRLLPASALLLGAVCFVVTSCAEEPVATGGALPLLGTGDPVAAAPAQPSAPPTDAAALDAWAQFPAGAHPRPIVLSALPQLPEGGFTSGDGKLAALDGRYELAAALPADPPPTVAVTLPDGPAQLPTMTARQALDTLSTAPPGSDGPAARITHVELGTATFGSDRGGLTLPAWLFTVDGAQGPIAVPAVAQSALWPRQPGGLVIGGGARVGTDGRTLKVVLVTGNGATCPGMQRMREEPAVLESASAVVVGLRSVADGVVPGTPVPDCGVAATGIDTEFTVPLASPLGGRVLLAVQGADYFEVMAVVPG
jgi:hypothetical protein